MISFLLDSPSGLWHHQQDKGQPFRKTVVRIPGPSWTANRFISKINPLDMIDITPIVFNILYI